MTTDDRDRAGPRGADEATASLSRPAAGAGAATLPSTSAAGGAPADAPRTRPPVPPSGLDPPVPAAAPTRPIAAGALDPPMPPRGGRPAPPDGTLDPALPPQRGRAAVPDITLDPALPPARRGTSAGLPSGSIDPVLPSAGSASLPASGRRSRPRATEESSNVPAAMGIVAAGAVAVMLALRFGGDAGPDRSRLSLEEERAVADAWSKEGLARLGGARTDGVGDAVARSVGAYGRMLGERLGGRGLRTLVVEAPTTVDIFSLPDGTVVLTSGLVAKLSSEAELSALVAHVTGHVALDHTARAIASAVPTIRSATRGGTTSVVDATLTPLLQAPFSKEQEAAVDTFVEQTMLATGWDVAAYAKALQVLAETAPTWARNHSIDELRLRKRSEVESSGRTGSADYRSRMLVPLGVVPAAPPPSTTTPKRRTEDEEEDRHSAAATRDPRKAGRAPAAPSRQR